MCNRFNRASNPSAMPRVSLPAPRPAHGDAAVPVRLEPGGVRNASRARAKIAREEARPGGQAANRWERPARKKGDRPCGISFPLRPPHPLRGKARCGIVVPLEARPLRRAPAARHVGFSPSASCRCPHAQAQAFPCGRRKSAAQPGDDAPARSESNGCVSHKVYTIGPNVFTKVCYTNVHAWASMRFYVRGAFRRRITGRRARVAPRPSGQPPGEPFKEGFA